MDAGFSAVTLATTDITTFATVIKAITENMPQMVKFDAALRKMPQACKDLIRGSYHSSGVLTLECDVSSMKDVLPLLEFCELAFDLDFDKTVDSSYDGSRDFKAGHNSWLVISATPKPDSPGCRRVITGYSQQPIYKIECLEVVEAPPQLESSTQAAALPAPKETADDIPF